MLLVHKPMPALSFAHRRLPSAPPAINVRPTSTPGILSISNNRNQSPKIPRKRQQQPSLDRRPRKEAGIVSRKQPPSHRNHQPSPPPLESANPRNPDSDSELSASKSAPTLINQPSGRLARSRRKANNKKDQEDPTPTVTQPVTIPRRRNPSTPTRPQANQVSRSAPPVAHRPVHRRSETVQDSDILPLAEWDASPPSTPKRHSQSSWQQALMDNGPRTAPLTATTSMPFVFPNAMSTPPRHRRMPSYGDVFSLPFDEDHHSGAESDHSVPLKSLLASMKLGPTQQQLDRLAYANSSFQNSPSPNELPPPSSFVAVPA